MYNLINNKIGIALFLLAAATMLGACGWVMDGQQRIDDQYGMPEDGDLDEDIPEDELGEVEGEGLAGQWAMMMKLEGEFAPMIETWGIELTNLFLVSVNEDETEMTLTFCDQISQVSRPSGISDFGRTSIPQALKDALGAKPISLTLPGDGTTPSQSVVWTWGLNLTDPRNDNLSDMDKDGYTPTGDPRVIDEDNDGKPGATIHVLQPEGDRYMARRVFWELGEATMTADKQYVEGPMHFTLDEHAVGANPNILKTAAPITEVENSNSRFSLRRLKGITVEDGDLDTDTELVDGDVSDGDSVDGDSVDGDSVDGDVVDGDTTDGDSVDGDLDAETETETEIETEVEAEIEAETEVELEAEVDVEIEAELEAESDIEDEVETETPSRQMRIMEGEMTCEQLIANWRSMFKDR